MSVITPVKCVIGCTTIGGAEAAKVAVQFGKKENVVATLSVTPCWCCGSVKGLCLKGGRRLDIKWDGDRII
ncbi:MAG: hypothetical protein KH216_06300 [Clostridiales bacterium]|nr:hypothetical protein [Clostridiales bacterium]